MVLVCSGQETWELYLLAATLPAQSSQKEAFI